MNKLLLLFSALAFLSCSKNDDNTSTNPINQLPPATQTGKNTFGCLLDGEVFKPGVGSNPLDCVYQFVDGGYYFSLQANKKDKNNIRVLIGCSTQNLILKEGENYTLSNKIDGNAYGTIAYAGFLSNTSHIVTGEMRITTLTNTIVSGTFWFDIIDYAGTPHKIREGRFDMQYTD